MDYYNANDPASIGYRVEFEGVFRNDAVEASTSGGWVKTEKKTTDGWGGTKTRRQTLWGRVFIVKYGIDEPGVELESKQVPEPTYD